MHTRGSVAVVAGFSAASLPIMPVCDFIGLNLAPIAGKQPKSIAKVLKNQAAGVKCLHLQR